EKTKEKTRENRKDKAAAEKKSSGNGKGRHGGRPEVEVATTGLSRVLGRRKEAAALALTEGFHDLSSLLKGIQERMDGQDQRSAGLNEKFSELPAMAKAQVEFMGSISQQMLVQKEKTTELLTKLGGLPELLEGIHTALQKQAANEERTEKTLSEFRQTMNRMHDSMTTLTRENQDAVKESTQSLERVHTRTTRVFEDSQRQALDRFEKVQSTQLEQITKLMDRARNTNRGIGLMLFLMLGAIVALLGVVFKIWQV
ncbi:MAG: hypothetical protein ACE5F1_21215, partial [Planctomycetota bacterium]